MVSEMLSLNSKSMCRHPGNRGKSTAVGGESSSSSLLPSWWLPDLDFLISYVGITQESVL